MAFGLAYVLRCCFLFLEISTQCGSPCGSHPDPHQGAGHSDRETDQGAGDGPPQHENRTAGGRHAASPTNPPPQKHHQSTVSVFTVISSFPNQFLFFESLTFYISMFSYESPLDYHSHPWATPWDLEAEGIAAGQSEGCGGWWGMSNTVKFRFVGSSALKGFPTMNKLGDLWLWEQKVVVWMHFILKVLVLWRSLHPRINA